MHRVARLLGCSLIATSLLGCGPSPIARNPPPADPGTASLRLGDDPVVQFDAPLSCVNGVSAERSTSPTSLFCSVSAPEADSFEVHLLLELGATASNAEGTELSTQSEIQLVRAGAHSDLGNAVTAEASSWDGTVTLRLGAPGTPRTAVLDGALSSVFTPSIAMTFNAVPIVIQ